MIELQILVYGIVTTALFFDFVNGFQDSANSIATVVGIRVLKPIQAVTMAAVANFIGPFVWHCCSSYSWKGNYSTRVFYSICYFCGTNRSNCLGFNYMVLWYAIIKQQCINWRPHCDLRPTEGFVLKQEVELY